MAVGLRLIRPSHSPSNQRSDTLTMEAGAMTPDRGHAVHRTGRVQDRGQRNIQEKNPHKIDEKKKDTNEATIGVTNTHNTSLKFRSQCSAKKRSTRSPQKKTQ